MRDAVYQRDRGVCKKCGADATRIIGARSNGTHVIWDREFGKVYASRIEWLDIGWIADHILPLWMVPRVGEWADVIKYWSLDNLQTLCRPCNKEKTAKDQGDIAKVKRHACMRR